MKGWVWVPDGDENPADLTTKPVAVKDIGAESMWQRGPAFLYLPEDQWPIKTSFSKEKLEGEMMVHHVEVVYNCIDKKLQKTLVNCDRYWKLMGSTARLLRLNRGLPGVSTGASHLKSLYTVVAKEPTIQELDEAVLYWVKKAQEMMEADLAKSVPREKTGRGDPALRVKITGRYKALAPKKDENGVWRVGTRMNSCIPFTNDGRPPILLPFNHRVTWLLMLQVHKDAGDVGAEATLAAFRQRGYWVPQGGKMAKSLRSKCVPCRKLDAACQKIPLGPIPDARLAQPVAWGRTELDLFGPYWCRGETDPRKKVKVWGIIMEDKNSTALHLDIVSGYSTDDVLAALRRFASVRGWPAVITSDPGSQLESASGKLAPWWDSMGEKLESFAAKKKCKWEISPANSPWRQGTVESRIAVVKRLIKRALGDNRLTATEFQTTLIEIGSTCNEKPLALSQPKEDGTYTVITANHLLMGRSMAAMPDDSNLCEELNYKSRYHLINAMTTAFWNLWAVVCAPKLVRAGKWRESSVRDVQVGDLEMVTDKNAIKSKYRLGIILEATKSSDGRVRSTVVQYFLPHTNKASNAKGKRGREITITRSAQRLAVILAVEEQERPLFVVEGEEKYEVVAAESTANETD